MAIYVCIDHSDSLLKRYFDSLNDVFYKISKKNSDNELINSLDQIVLDDFKRRKVL